MIAARKGTEPGLQTHSGLVSLKLNLALRGSSRFGYSAVHSVNFSARARLPRRREVLQ